MSMEKKTASEKRKAYLREYSKKYRKDNLEKILRSQLSAIQKRLERIEAEKE